MYAGKTAAELQRDQLIALIVAEMDSHQRNVAPFRATGWPDVSERRAPAVELVGIDEGGSVVVEHTMVESFGGQAHDGHALSDVFEDGGPHRPDIPNAGHYRLLAPVRSFSSIPHADEWRRGI